MTTRTLRQALAFTLLVLLAGGCSSDDDDPGTPPIPQIDDPQLAALVQETALLTQEVIDACAAAATGQLGGKEDVAPWWDEGTSCWRWSSENGDWDDPQHTWGRGWNFAVTYYQGETPQMHLAGADRITLEAGYHFNDYDFDSEEDHASRTFYVNLALEGTPLEGGVFAVSGSGWGQLMVSGARQGNPYDFYDDVYASTYLTIPPGGCPTGGLDLDIDPRSFSIGFDGTTRAHWDYVRGPGDLEEGSFTITCGK